MTDISAITIKRVEGYLIADDQKHAIVGVESEDGEKFGLAVTHDLLQSVINGFVAALGAFSKPKLSTGQRLIIPTDWYEVGRLPNSDLLAITFRLGNGGAMSFAFDRLLAERLQETLSSALGTGPMAPPRGTKQ